MDNKKNRKILSAEEMKGFVETKSSGSGSIGFDDPCYLVFRCSNGNIIGCFGNSLSDKCVLIVRNNEEVIGIQCGNQPMIPCNAQGSGSGSGSGSSGSGSGTNPAIDPEGGLL